MPIVKIPEDDLPALLDLAGMDEVVFTSLLSGIEQSQPTLKPSDLVDQLVKSVKLESARLFPMVRAILRIYDLKGGSADAAKTVAESAAAQKKIEFTPELISMLQSRLAKVLGFDGSLGVTSKALDVMREHQHTFCNARIISDVRPIFANTTKKASAAVIVHNLQIGYHEPGSKAHKEFYVALDTQDIQKLKEVIARAEEKTEALQAIVNAASVRYLDV
jgi:hypothetical protein